MATINKGEKKKRENKPKQDKTKLIYDTVYNTGRWRNIRNGMLIKNPLCQNCLRDLATEVHHIKPISTVDTPEEMMEIGFDPSNLICLCSKCHQSYHKEYKRSQLEDFNELVEKIKKYIN